MRLQFPRYLASALTLASASTAQQLQTVANFGANPTGLTMQIYVPTKLAEKPAIILALHFCGGTGSVYSQVANYMRDADAKGFVVIYPSTPHDNRCWDVHSPESLMHEGGGDTTTLANMVRHATATYKADPARIFVTGSSSGCMMTNVLSATYPDLFAAATCYSGVPAGCFIGSAGSSPTTATGGCAAGLNPKTGAEWAAIARAMYPGYQGAYPRFATWHGKADTFVSYLNLEEQVKQWSAVHGVEFVRNVTDTPVARYTRMLYGDGSKFVAYSAEGVGHTVPVRVADDLAWFGL